MSLTNSILCKYLIVLIILLNNSITSAQIQVLGVSEIYALKIDIDSFLITDDCPCPVDSINECSLFKIKVKEVFYIADSTLNKRENLLQLKYLIVPNKNGIKLDKTSIITASLSSSLSYIIMVKQFNIHEYPTFVTNNIGFFTGLSKCFKPNLWRRFLILTHLRKRSYFFKKEEDQDKFSKFIKK